METQKYQVATFAGGCFWCVESDFEKVEGVVDVISGYTGGQRENPTYKQVSGGITNHTEAVQVRFDPGIVTYDALLEVFWRHINPTDGLGQFVDRGQQYRAEIFYHTPEQKQKAEESRKRLEEAGIFDRPVVTPVTRATTFYPAEDYHQNYYKKNPVRYKYYRWGSGRDQFLEKAWKGREGVALTGPARKTTEPAVRAQVNTSWTRPSETVIKERLTPLQYKVTQKDGTERPFENEFWDNKEEGIYVDIVSGEPLFSSKDKFRSGTGWPSFTRPLEPDHVVEKQDRAFFMVRTEVRSRHADSHLGHVFDDGPEPTGLRYCINSAALRFIPRADLEKEGYGQYLTLF